MVDKTMSKIDFWEWLFKEIDNEILHILIDKYYALPKVK
jgi:hypothetical protein